MLSEVEAMQVLQRIMSHHGGQQLTSTQVEQFASELDASLSMREAVDAVSEFYARREGALWMGSSDVNRLVLAARARRLPSDAELGFMCLDAGIVDGASCWRFCREFKSLVMAGVDGVEARRRALVKARA